MKWWLRAWAETHNAWKFPPPRRSGSIGFWKPSFYRRKFWIFAPIPTARRKAPYWKAGSIAAAALLPRCWFSGARCIRAILSWPEPNGGESAPCWMTRGARWHPPDRPPRLGFWAFPACPARASPSLRWRAKPGRAKSANFASASCARKRLPAASPGGTFDQMLARIQAGEQKEVAVVIKADVQGSAEAIEATVQKLGTEEVQLRVLHAAVGQITESDVQLAKASGAVIIGFNVRATAQARELARREGVEIRYYNIIYDVADDISKLIAGKTAPKAREKFLGYAEVRKVFDISKVGKVAGCMVTEGVVKRGAGVRLLRDGVVIHQGELSTLKRFKEDVREVARGYECGLSFAGFQDIREGDVVECFETEVVPA